MRLLLLKDIRKLGNLWRHRGGHATTRAQLLDPQSPGHRTHRGNIKAIEQEKKRRGRTRA